MNTKISFISSKYPTFRDETVKSPYRWLYGKTIDDGAEGFWRIHNGIYDLTEFIDKHPGGAEWLKLTKGTDITEAFETHHIRNTAENLLPKYKIKDATVPRNIKLTFKENGFYRTLKRRVNDQYDTIDFKPASHTKVIHDSLLISTIIALITSANLNSFYLAMVSGLLLTWTAIASHNFFHKKDNWRMYTFNLSFLSYRDWRISHALSHHLYTNSLLDLEISYFEPYLCWLPDSNIKNLFQRYGSWFYSPLVYAVMFYVEFLRRFLTSLFIKNNLFKSDFIPFLVPIAMFLFSNLSLTSVINMWLFTVMVASFIFGFIGLNASHHHPDIAHDGDKLRDDLDWGLFQLDTVVDHKSIKGCLFLVLTHFGDHCLHHLFPTLDHAILPQLYPIFYETCKEFETELDECNLFHHVIGQFSQLARIEPKTVARSIKKKL